MESPPLTRATSLTETYPNLRALEEPTRSVALETLDRLLQAGCSEAVAVEQAIAEALEWAATRVPSVARPDAKESES
jgi:uncharacterized protein YdaT